jgi:hypothetical protein
MPRLLLPLAVALLVGCGTPIERDCSSEDDSRAEALPDALSETGLYADIAAAVVADRVIEFSPRFPLWTDGADKRRWLLLPEGERVDTSDPEAWVFPVGTKTFKEFALDGVALETRMNTRTADGWASVSYVWDGADAAKQMEAAPDVAGTPHDVPSAGECLACHGGRGNFILGFSATQLEPAVRAQLFADGVLSDAVDGELDLPAATMAGLGVLHGNCSHCHNAQRLEQPQATTCFDPSVAEDDEDELADFTLPHDLAAVEDAPVLQTARWLLAGDDGSEIVARMSERNTSVFNPSMPPLGTEIIDEAGIAAIEAMLAELPANGGR